MIEIRHLHYIVTTADMGSFNRAAGAMRIRQSTLSRRIRHLELRLGIALFERSTRGVKLTQAGICFLTRARQVLDDLDGMRRDIGAFVNGDQGRMVIGLSDAVPPARSQSLLLDYSLRYPGVDLATVTGDAADFPRQLVRGGMDAALCPDLIASPGLALSPLGSDRVMAVVDPAHALSERDHLYWTDLEEMTVLLPVGAALQDVIGRRFALGGSKVRIVTRPLGTEALFCMVGGDRITIIDESLMATVPPALRAVPLHDLHGSSRLEYGLCWHPANANPALARLLALIRERRDRAA